MFCPSCRAEYVDGIQECADCRVGLVPVLPPVAQLPEVDFELVLSIFNVGDLAVIKSVFDAEKIDYVLHGENFNLVDPMIQPTRLYVNKMHVPAAKDLLSKMNLHYLSLSPREDEESQE